MSRPTEHDGTAPPTEMVIHGHLRDGSHKEMTLYEDSVNFSWSRTPLISWIASGHNVKMPWGPWGYTCRYPLVRRVWIEGCQLWVETYNCTHWIRFRRRDASEAQKCCKFMEDRIPSPGEIEVGRQELEHHPERYHARRIRVRAWVWRQFEGSLLVWDRDEFLAQRLDPLGRQIAFFNYVLNAFDGSAVERGWSSLPMQNPRFWRIRVAIHAKREFLEAAGELARSQAVIDPPTKQSGWLRRNLRSLSDRIENQLSCSIDLPDPDEGIYLRFLEGLFGPMMLCGVFEHGLGSKRGCAYQSVLTVDRVVQQTP